jgi:hypothetical protein
MRERKAFERLPQNVEQTSIDLCCHVKTMNVKKVTYGNKKEIGIYAEYVRSVYCRVSQHI